MSDPEVREDIKQWPFIVKEQGEMPVMQVEYKGENKTFVSRSLL